MFEKILGNANAKNILKRLLEKNRVPHSFLFSGLEGIGKKQFAIEIAKSLVCSNTISSSACGTCKDCGRASNFSYPKSDDRDSHKKIIYSEHTDVGIVIPYRNNILVDAIRDLENAANFRPYEANARIFIVDDADGLNDSAANALLKTLEEPSETTYLFLVTSRPSTLLPTIHSRCQRINFAPVETNEIEKFILEKENIPTEDAKLRAKISGGSVGRALNLDLEKYYEHRLKMLDVLRSLNSSRNFSILLKTSEEIADPKNRDDYENSINTLELLLVDIWTLGNAENAEAVNFDISKDLRHLAQNIDNQTVSNWIREVETLTVDLKSNLNRKVATDALFMKMAG